MLTYAATRLSILFQTENPLDRLPQEVIDRLPDDIVRQLRDGVIDQIPEDVVDRLPDSVADRIPSGLIDFASSNPTMAVILAVIGVLAILGFIYGVMKSAVKVMLFSIVAGVAAWWFFFQV
jgi:hypothetical protein